MTTVAFVPARGGSTRIPRKNLAEVGGRSLLQRAVDVGLATCDRVVVSTDDDEIAGIAAGLGAEVHRRPDARDGQIEDVIAHWLRREGLAPDDVIVLAQPTSPFRRAETVAECVRLVREHGCDSALAILTDVRREMFSGRLRARFDPATGTDIAPRVIFDRPLSYRPRSQDVHTVGVEAGSVYAFTVRHFRATGCRMGGRDAAVKVPWLEAFEVDCPVDLLAARALAPLADIPVVRGEWHSEDLLEMLAARIEERGR